MFDSHAHGARMALETGARANDRYRGTIAVCNSPVRRRSGPRRSCVFSEVLSLKPVRNPVDECVVCARDVVLLDGHAIGLAIAGGNRIEADVERCAGGFRRDDGAVVRVLSDRTGHWAYPHLEPLRGVRTVQPYHCALLPLLR